MRVIIKLGLVLFLMLPGITLAAEPNLANYAKINQQLKVLSRDLRDVAKSMQSHAKSTIPTGLNKNEKLTFLSKVRDLEVAADAAMKLASKIDIRANRAQRRVLTRADMDSLYIDVDVLKVKIKRISSKNSKTRTWQRKDPKIYRDKLHIKEPEEDMESVRNKRQEYQTMFENFDQKTNQLFNILSTVMKSMKEMQQATTRNLL